jgi:signal transduction histidine kinase
MKKHTIQIVCADLKLLRRYRVELERTGEPYQFRLAQSPDEARRSFLQVDPAVILLDESAAPASSKENALDAVAAELTEAAPVVVVAVAERQTELAFLLGSGAADFVVRRGSFVSVAADAVERRVRFADYATGVTFPAGELTGDFGEILRHEVNNPLTGILGNAELLLVGRDRLPPDAIARVETIAELAVRLRETVRRLSHTWETRPDPVRSA